MAIDRNTRYPGRFDAPTAARPQGAFKNRSAPGAKDGSYLERDWANDWDGFFGSLMRSAGLTANGTPDTALSSQYFDALKKLLPVQATESVSGIAAIATTAMAQSGTDDIRQMTALKTRQAYEATDTSMIAGFPLSLPPAGWIKANGAAVSRTFYSRLFSVIGTDFGVGDGFTTFNIPDVRGLFQRAWDDGRGIDPGRVIGSKQKGSLIAYDPTTVESAVLGLHSKASDANTRNDLGVDMPVPSDYPNADAISILGSSTYSVAQATGVARPANIALLFCIKY